ncbi:hypothetical protein BDP27DRAFT_518276 [Rhodocollybia butyracea]|uniref:Uncharacterized protein n=1 Tax=Rhodocollybia butyracea TaxID=206335 RepID=A0A9P5PZP0_9AGAR|nr:hypothetical protein BDP27DRAFT_518276 [Rhodocollybia butyracea]
MYALLALNLPKKDVSGFASSNGSSKKSNAGAIAGGVVGGIAFIALIGLALLFSRRRRIESVRNYNDDKAGGFAMMFRPKKPRVYASQEALSGYQIEPFGSSERNFTDTPGGTTSRSNIVGTPSHYTTSSSGEPNPHRGPMYPPVPIADSSRAPLHVNNAGDEEEGYPSQAPPLPRKAIPATTASSIPSSTSGPSVVSSSEPSGSSDAAELRNEVENLRREMQEMRSRTAYEPPPEYQ